MADFQLFIIGAGPGGYTAAIRAGRLGLRTALAEARDLGGTCLNRGCIPTKTLLHASAAVRAAGDWGKIGLRGEAPVPDTEAMYQRVEEVVRIQQGGIEALLKAAGVTLLRGHAVLEGPGRVSVNGETYTADKVLLAAGSKPARLPLPGAELPGVYTSDDLLRAPGRLFRSIVIIGGGVIGCELASFYADLGADVTILEAKERLLPLLDRDLGEHLQSLFKRRKITVRCGALVEKIEEAAEPEGFLTVRYQHKKKDKAETAEAVLMAAGRAPVTEGLFGEGVSPDMNGRFVKTDVNFETSIPGVYAVGDLIGGLQLAHEAEAEGQAVVRALAGLKPETNVAVVPSAIYTEPEIASVGPSEEALQAAGVRYKAGRAETLTNARCLIDGADRGFVKILAEEETGRLLAAHMIAPRASDLIAGVVPFVAGGLSYKAMLYGMRPHPSYSEILTEALEAIDGEALHAL